MVTVIREKERFAFVHIPKCGGTSIRFGLEKAVTDRHAGEHWLYGNVVDHAELGKVMLAHKPLKMLEEYFPNELKSYRNCECFAVVREIHSRFASAMQQHIREFLRTDISAMSQSEIHRAIDRVIAKMSDRPVYPGVEFVHFLRQADFIFLDFEKVVQNIYTLENIDVMAEDIGRLLHRRIDFNERSNTSSGRPSAGFLTVRAIGRQAKHVMPQDTYEKVRRTLTSTLISKPPPEKLAIFKSRAVTDFVDRFYSRDTRIVEDARRDHQTRLGRRPATATNVRAG